MDRAKLEALLNRVVKATGPDRELDHLVHDQAVEPIGSRMYNTKENGGSFIAADVVAPSYTASIDAALALVERVLPGWFWRVGHSTLYAGWATVYREHPNNTTGDGEHFAEAKSAPLAILAALLKALVARDEQ